MTKRIVSNLDKSYYPTAPIVPSTEIVHDRVNVELFRGCVRGCRFCQAGYVYRPIRARSAERVIEIGKESLKNTGCQEATLLSLSSSDYKHLTEACDGLLDWCEPQNISLSLPSLRADNFSMELMSRLQKVRRGGLTFAPEAGTQRLRDVINKNVTEDDLLNTCRISFEGGWNGIKLYFMLGLPTETDEDVRGIADLASKVLHVWRQYSPNKQRGVRITVSTSCFIPKPHSPFQWEAQVSMEEYRRRVELLRSSITAKNVSYNWHDPDTSFVEAALSRGDRKIADVIEAVWRAGGRMEAWSDYFRFERWMRAFEDCGLDPAFYASRERGEDEVLPWCRVNMGVRESLLLRERHRPTRRSSRRTAARPALPAGPRRCWRRADAMDKLRLRFQKAGKAVYISHLDLMRVVQRIFLRAGTPIKYSEGFNPHALISICLPLSVGMASECELMDFRVTREVELAALPETLNAVSPEGVRFLAAYEPERKAALIKWLRVRCEFEYDSRDALALLPSLRRISPRLR